MKMFHKKVADNRGFTMIEVIAVLIILGIISAVFIVRGMGTEAVKLQAEVDTLKGHLRYAQYLAINDISPTKWGINLADSYYTLVKNASGDGVTFTSPFSLPNESSATHSFAPITATSATVLFDEWGSPDITSLAFGGQSVTITAETGFIP